MSAQRPRQPLKYIDHTVVRRDGAAEPRAIYQADSLVIMPGDRTDNMLVSIVVLSNEAPSTAA